MKLFECGIFLRTPSIVSNSFLSDIKTTKFVTSRPLSPSPRPNMLTYGKTEVISNLLTHVSCHTTTCVTRVALPLLTRVTCAVFQSIDTLIGCLVPVVVDWTRVFRDQDAIAIALQIHVAP